MRVLVTGGNGFLGKPTVTSLKQSGHTSIVLSRNADTGPSSCLGNFLNRAERQRLIKIAKADALVHLAWFTHPGKFWTSPHNVAWTNASSDFIEQFFEAGGQRAIIAGTCAEYDWGVAENSLSENSPCHPATLYGSCKLNLYRHCENLIGQGASIAWGRLFFLCGPEEHPSRFVPAIIRPLLAGTTAQMGKGSQIRDFLHVSDAGRALAALVQNDGTGAINIASGFGVSLAKFARAAQKEIGRGKIEFGTLPARAKDPPKLVADIHRLKSQMNFQPLFDWHTALKNCIDYWRYQHNIGHSNS